MHAQDIAWRKATLTADGEWIEIEVRRIRDGAGERELPTDGSADLGEAVARAAARLRLARVFPKCSGAEPLPMDGRF